MPPPPPPKRLKRPPKTLSEEDYTSAITTIIERDFYPQLSEMRKQTHYLDAVEEGNPIRIATAARRLTTPIRPTGQGGDEEDEDEDDRKERMLREDVLGMRLDTFQAKYTSEDNESFNSLLDSQNAKNREKYSWKFHGNKKLSKQQFQIEQKKVLLLEKGLDDVVVPGEREEGEGEDEKWSKEIQLWEWSPMNVLMNPHPGMEDQVPAAGMEQKLIRHDNTRVAEPTRLTGKTPAPSPSISTIEDAISGGRPRSDTPKVNGYSFVSTPKPTDLGAPKMTWGEITSTPISLDEKPSPFRLPQISEREKLARKLAEKAQKDITNRQRAYTPQLRKSTTTLGPSSAILGKEDVGGGVPKFMSSPVVRRNLLTPAGKRLLENSTQGRRSSSRLATGSKLTGSSSSGNGHRESAAQVSAGIVGRTPLMRTPLLKDGATPLRKK